jgi:hypothetical protein
MENCWPDGDVDCVTGYAVSYGDGEVEREKGSEDIGQRPKTKADERPKDACGGSGEDCGDDDVYLF